MKSFQVVPSRFKSVVKNRLQVSREKSTRLDLTRLTPNTNLNIDFFLCLVGLQECYGDLALSSSPQLLLDALDIISIQEQVDNMAAKYRVSTV